MGDAITTYYLEMTSPDQLLARPALAALEVRECRSPQFEFNRFLYQLVGAPWQWTDKLGWSDEQWRLYAEARNLRTWVAYCEGAPAGYYELQRRNDGDLEIAYFGLAPAFTGRGFGGYLLSHALRSAWSWPGTLRVRVHTCSLDHPAALSNYQARGMTLYKTETNDG